MLIFILNLSVAVFPLLHALMGADGRRAALKLLHQDAVNIAEDELKTAVRVACMRVRVFMQETGVS